MSHRLGDILSSMHSGVGKTLKLCNLLTIWDEVVDERVRKHTEAVKIRSGILYVYTSSSAWAQELSFLKGPIVEKFNLVAGEEAISDIRFTAKGRLGGV